MDRVIIARDGPVTRLMLNTPATMNAIDAQMHIELEAAFNAYARDPAQRVCVVTGAGDRAFCAGSDLKAAYSSGFSETNRPMHGYAGIVERFDLDKPTIAAVNGLALGGGFELALACDIILAADHASFGLPEPRVGAVALGGGIHRLAREIGRKNAMGLLMTGRRVDAAEALRLGFINAVAGPGELDTLTQQWIADILACAPLAVQATKRAMLNGLEARNLAAAMRGQADDPSWRRWRASADTSEGIAAFVEKRAPVWTGQ